MRENRECRLFVCASRISLQNIHDVRGDKMIADFVVDRNTFSPPLQCLEAHACARSEVVVFAAAVKFRQ